MTTELKLITCLLCLAWSTLAIGQCPDGLNNTTPAANGNYPLTLLYPGGLPQHTIERIQVDFTGFQYNGDAFPVTSVENTYQTMGVDFENVTLEGTLTLIFIDNSTKNCNIVLDSPTPVELSEWSGNLKNNDIELRWSTAWEEHNAGFEIQRSFDGVRFETIAMVNGAGDSQLENYYQFVDVDVRNKALGSTAYYRLVQVDYDGRRTLSPVIAIDLELDYSDFEITKVTGVGIGERRISVYYYNPSNVRKINLIVSNLQGNLILTTSLQPSPGINVFELDLSQHPGDIIILSMDNGRSIIQEKFFLGDIR